MNRRVRSALQAYWERSDAPGYSGHWVSWLLALPSWVYAAVQTVRRGLYRRGVLRARKLVLPVVSVGGLRVGGSGKTPFTCWLAGRLRDQGYRVAVLTRGYGRSHPREGLILHASSNRHRWDPDRCGDEPCLLAGALRDVPVVVDADRYRGALNVLRSFPVDVFILDDGFQHLALARDCDIVLVPDDEDVARTSCLPRGPAREPASALRDADIVVRLGTGAGPDPAGCPEARASYEARLVPGALRLLGGSETMAPASLEGERVFAFCGIARPRAFWASLEQTGLKVAEHVAYPDHHRYSVRDHRILLERLARFDRAVTTEKDAVKLARFPWPTGKLLVLGVQPVLAREREFWEFLLSRVARGGGNALQPDVQRGS